MQLHSREVCVSQSGMRLILLRTLRHSCIRLDLSAPGMCAVIFYFSDHFPRQPCHPLATSANTTRCMMRSTIIYIISYWRSKAPWLPLRNIAEIRGVNLSNDFFTLVHFECIISYILRSVSFHAINSTSLFRYRCYYAKLNIINCKDKKLLNILNICIVILFLSI